MARTTQRKAATQAWQLTLPCTRDEARAIDMDDGEALAAFPVPPAITTSEPDPARPDAWLLDAIFDHKPSGAEIAIIRTLAPSARAEDAQLAPLPDVDWVVQSQAGLAPITAGRFHIIHDASEPPATGHVNFLIPASRAFGTGQHETTHGCLMMLDRMARRGQRFRTVADIGTGTGLLAFAALALWPRARVLASDIDPVSIEVTAENAGFNHIALGSRAGEALLVAAPGVDHPLITGLAPYDLLIANILAGPLIELAPGLCAQLAEGGSLILAGLLADQALRVLAAYRAEGMMLVQRIDNGQWPTLLLRKRPRHGWRRRARWRPDRHGNAPGFGSW